MITAMRALVILAMMLAFAVPAHAASPIVPADPVADATVNLFCRLKSGNKVYTTTGTGVFISERGAILTNAHVAQYFLLAAGKGRVRGECSVRTGSPAEDAYTASVLYLPPAWIEANKEALLKRRPKGTGENDFALLYITDAKKGAMLPTRFPALPLSYLYSLEGDAVTVAGYATEGLETSEIRYTLPLRLATTSVTNVRGFARSGADVLTLASSTAASAGVSGGPVIRADGALAGIVVAKSEAVLRAITVPYINRALMEQGIVLPSLLAADYATRAAESRALLTPKQLLVLRDGLLRIR